MKSRKVKAAAKSKVFISKKNRKGDIPLDVSDSGSDIDSDSFFHDEIDDYHKEQDDQLPSDDELIRKKHESSEEEEVLPISDDEKDDSDENDAYDDLPNLEAWGKKKSMYYNADFVDEDRGRTYREEDAEAAKAEAEEAYAIQKSVYSNITAENLGANLFLEGSEESEDQEEKEENLSSATKQEKLKFLKKTSLEMFEYIKDFKASMVEIQDRLLPLLPIALGGNLPTEACAEYIKIKYHILLHLSMNINFYMMLKSSGAKTQHHPVNQRISSLKKVLDQLKPIDDAVTEDINFIVQKLKQKKDITMDMDTSVKDNAAEDVSVPKRKSKIAKTVVVEETSKIKKPKRKNIDTEVEKEIMSLIEEVKQEMKKKKVENEDDIQDEKTPLLEDESEKRMITYQIAKNKGLTPHRKKEYRNPRVKHRIKFKKAQVRRKGQVREVIKEIKRYEGEPTGISTHVIKSIKLK